MRELETKAMKMESSGKILCPSTARREIRRCEKLTNTWDYEELFSQPPRYTPDWAPALICDRAAERRKPHSSIKEEPIIANPTVINSPVTSVSCQG